MTTPPLAIAPDPASEPPPLLGTWRRLYTVVVLSQVGVVAALWWLAEAFS